MSMDPRFFARCIENARRRNGGSLSPLAEALEDAPSLHYDMHAGRGPYCLFVHGYLSSRAQWLPNLDALSRLVQPVVVELYGHGRSLTPEDPSAYEPGAYIKQFEKLRVDLGIEQWLICGQSLGAPLTQRYAPDHPDRIVDQVLPHHIP